MGVWDSFWQGAEIGEHYGDLARNRRGFQADGYAGVEREAANAGDMQTAMSTRRFQDQNQQRAFEWFEQNAPRARNVLRRARAIEDPQQRAAFLDSQRQWFEGVGFEAPKIDAAIAGLTGPEAEQWFLNLDAGFAQYEDPNWQLVQTHDGQRAVAINPGGDVQLGGLVPGGGAGRYATEDEVAAAGYRPGSVVWIEPGQPPRVIQAPSAARSTGAQYYPDDGYDYVEE